MWLTLQRAFVYSPVNFDAPERAEQNGYYYEDQEFSESAPPSSP